MKSAAAAWSRGLSSNQSILRVKAAYLSTTYSLIILED